VQCSNANRYLQGLVVFSTLLLTACSSTYSSSKEGSPLKMDATESNPWFADLVVDDQELGHPVAALGPNEGLSVVVGGVSFSPEGSWTLRSLLVSVFKIRGPPV
jgi:hypothetical protein